MNSTDTAQRVAEIASKLLSARYGFTEISQSQSLTTAGLNSLDMVNFLLMLEEVFDITVPSRAVNPANFHSIDAVTSLIEELKKKAA